MEVLKVVDDDTMYLEQHRMYLRKLMEEETIIFSGRYSHLTKKEQEANIVPVRTTPKIGRNEKCPCGSNKKYKNCCLTT